MIEVRQATPDDAHGLAVAHVASWQWAYAGLVADDVLAGLSVAGRAARWADILATADQSVTLVALDPEVAGAVVGFVSVGPGRDDVGGPEWGEVLALYVHPDRAGRAIGHALHEAGIAWLDEHGFGEARLWVLQGNDRAQRFYERHGWRADGGVKVDEGPQGVPLHELRYARAVRRPASS